MLPLVAWSLGAPAGEPGASKTDREEMLAAGVLTGGMVFDQERQQKNGFFISRSASCL